MVCGSMSWDCMLWITKCGGFCRSPVHFGQIGGPGEEKYGNSPPRSDACWVKWPIQLVPIGIRPLPGQALISDSKIVKYEVSWKRPPLISSDC